MAVMWVCPSFLPSFLLPQPLKAMVLPDERRRLCQCIFCLCSSLSLSSGCCQSLPLTHSLLRFVEMWKKKGYSALSLSLSLSLFLN